MDNIFENKDAFTYAMKNRITQLNGRIKTLREDNEEEYREKLRLQLEVTKLMIEFGKLYFAE